MKDICKMPRNKPFFEILRLHYLKFQIPPAYGLIRRPFKTFLQKKREEDQAAREAQFYKDQAEFYGHEHQVYNTNEQSRYPTEAPAQGYSTFGYSTFEYNK